MKETLIQPAWSAPRCVKAYTSTRSSPLYHSALGEPVRINRERLQTLLELPHSPIWLNQVHGATVSPALPSSVDQAADASFTDQPSQACVILTADCLPILLCHQAGTHVAAIHGGWRSLTQGIIQATLNALNVPPSTLLAWLGPAISQPHYEIDEVVRSLFIARYPETEVAFTPSSPNHWLADLYAIARIQLQNAGVNNISGGTYCTYRDADQFFSYRRDPTEQRRMASIIWIESDF